MLATHKLKSEGEKSHYEIKYILQWIIYVTKNNILILTVSTAWIMIWSKYDGWIYIYIYIVECSAHFPKGSLENT